MAGNDWKSRLIEVVDLDRQGRLGEAAVICENLLVANPAQPHVLCLLGRVQRRQDRFDEAAASLERARALAPRMPQLVAELGFLALSRKDASAAVEHFSTLVGFKPGSADAHFNLACAYEMAARYREAASHFEQALALNPQAPHEVLARLGAALLMAGDESGAAARFEAALEADPRHAPALYGLGMILGARGEFDSAGERFRGALAADPDFVEVYQQLAEIRRFETEDDADLLTMRELLERGECSLLASEKLGYALGKAHDDLGAYDQAFEYYAKANRLKRARVPKFDRSSHRAHVDRIIDTFSAGFLAERKARGSPERTPILIFGMPRSGTTLVEQILSSHSRVAAAGEQSYLERVSMLLGQSRPEPIREWSGRDVEHAGLGYLNALGQIAGAAERITDKMPSNFLHAGLMHLLFPQAALIHCRRDPVDTCLSIFFQDFGIANYYANDLEDIAFYYAEYARLMRHWRSAMPQAMFEVDYAALIGEQERVTRELIAFCGLEWEEGCLEFARNRRVVATLSRWQVRQPIYTESLGRREKYAARIEGLEAALSSSVSSS